MLEVTKQNLGVRTTVMSIWILFSHDGTCIHVVVAEHGRNPLLRVTCAAREGIDRVADEPGGGPLVVHLRSIRIVDEVLRDIRPELSSLLHVLDPLQHLVWIDIACHRHPVGLPAHHHGLDT